MGAFVNKPIYLNKPEVWYGCDGAPGSGWNGKVHLVEPMIENYEKFNSNTGWVPTGGDTWADVMQALSHYSYHVTGGQFVLCDLQGGFYKDGIVLTDPIVMSRSRRYGPTDLGPDGLTAFFNNHKCNKFCRAEWQKPRAQYTPIVAKRGTSMADSKGQLYVPTHASRPSMTRNVPPVPKFAAIKEEPY